MLRWARPLAGAIRLAAQAAPREVAISTLLNLASGGLTLAQLLVIRGVLAGILAGAAGSGYGPALAPLALFGLLQMVQGVATVYSSMQQQLVTELVQRRALLPIIDVATLVELDALDNPEYHDRIQRAQQTASIRPMQVSGAVLALGHSVFAMAGVMAALLILSPLLLAVILLGAIPLWLTTTRMSRAVYQFALDMTANERRRGYVLDTLLSRGAAKEMRAFGLRTYFRSLFERLTDERLRQLRRHIRHRTGLAVLGSGANALGGAATLALLVILIGSGHLGIAEAGAGAAAAMQLVSELQMIASSAGLLYESSLFLEDLGAFVDLLPAIKAARPKASAPNWFGCLQVRNVHFTYGASAPGGTGRERRAPALQGVSMTITRGEIVALVGENGSGKTTLAKVVCGLYAPQAGAVYWDGTDIAAVDPELLRQQITVLFQDFGQYWLTAGENIGLGRVERMGEAAAVREAARQAGADEFIERWPDQYEAQLGPIFERGRDLSLGQWQRLALARAFFRDAPLVVLDEPTASLDARAEAKTFERMRDLFRGRTVLLISHRFSTVRSADRIYVMKEGRIVEHGSHSELMAQGGLYAELFEMQAGAYADDPARAS